MATWKPGQAVSIVIQNAGLDGPVPIDWTKGTATITLKGPKTFTYTGLALNSNGATTISAPTTVGRYAINCGVTGVPFYILGDSGFGSAAYLVSQEHELGAVRLYTNPSTLVTGVPIQMYIVFVAAPGVPTPTGQFTVYIGSGSQFLYLRNGAYIGSGGTKTISFSPISNLYGAKSITINYFGDPYYKPQEWTFPITNPNIPGSGGTTPKKPTATPKPHSTATPNATATVGAGSGVASPPQAATPTRGAGPSVLETFGPFSGEGLIALLVVVALLALGGGVGTFVLLSRRGSAPVSPDYPSQWPARSPLDVDTAPNLDTTQPQAPPWWRKNDGPYGGQG